MLTRIRRRTRDRRRRATMIKTIAGASQPQRDELIVLAQRQGLL
ncbi:hypothetical protein ACVBEQ_23405 [Nakamurella sp. GG22]